MALKATIFKATVNVADMDREVYIDQSLTIAQHPSETLQRMMLRIVAWAVNANEQLTFTKGLCDEDQPDLWQVNYSDIIELWVDLGTPDEKRIKKGSVRAQQSIIYTYGENAAKNWWKQQQSTARKYKNLSVFFLSDESMNALADAATRTMNLQFTIQGGEIWLNTDNETIELKFEVWQEAES
ncbi:MAG: YaeQ family protein [Gammaproteobacteria bacterium]|nr:YaeQ family protein [Gammaproteobacteria bacterium]